MAIPYKVHALAYDEYIEAYVWYETQKEGLGDKFMQAVEQRLFAISKNPDYYTKLRGNFRQVKVAGFPFIIVYEFFPRRKYIHIAAICHSRRNPVKKYRKDR